MNENSNPRIVVEDHDERGNSPSRVQRVRRLIHNPFRHEHHDPHRISYVPPEDHDILDEALDHDPQAVREQLEFALGSQGHRKHWMVPNQPHRENADENRPTQETLLGIFNVPDTDSHDPYLNPFEYPDTSRDMTYDIPLITLNTDGLDGALGAADLEKGLYRPPQTPTRAPAHRLAPGLPLKLANIFTRISDRIAGSNNPPTPSMEASHSAFKDNELIDLEQASRASDRPLLVRHASDTMSLHTMTAHNASELILGSQLPSIQISQQSPNISAVHTPSLLSLGSLPHMSRSEASGSSQHGDSLLVVQRLPSIISRESMESIRSIPTVELTEHPNISAPTLQATTSNFHTGHGPITGAASPFFRPGSRDDEGNFDHLYLYGKSLRIFAPDSKFRIWCHRFLSRPQTNSIVLVLIVLQTGLLCYRQWDPINHKGYYYAGYDWADFFLMLINVIYTAEIFIKVVAYGLLDDQAMFEELGLTFPRSGFTYAATYIRDSFFSNFLWWIPRLKKKIKTKEEKTVLFEPNLNGKYARFMDEDIPVETFYDNPEIIQSEQSAPIQRRNSVSSLTDLMPERNIYGYRKFLQSTHIHKKVEEMNLHRAYLRNNWQRLDFISITSFWISLPLSINHYDAKHHFMLFRALSGLRILRLCNLTTGTNIILRACQSAIPQLVDISIAIACFWVIFGIIGVQSFKSSLTRHCEWTNPDDSSDKYINTDSYCGSYIDLQGHAKPYISRDGEESNYVKGFRCPMYSQCVSLENPYNGTVNFDNIMQLMQLVFVVMSVNAFSDLMYYLMDTDNIGASLFFVFGILIMTVWLMNIFIAVIVSSFKVVLEAEEEEKRQRAERRKKPLFFNIWRFNDEMHSRQVLSLIQKRKFLRLYYRAEYIFVLIIMCDLTVQCLRSEYMNDERAHFLYRCEAVFTAIFFAEIIIRFVLYLPHWKVFFKSKMNTFDLFLAAVTSIIILDPVKTKLGHAYYWLTVFQIARFYRVVLAHRVSSDLWLKLMDSLKAIYDLALFYFILLSMVSILAARYFEGQVPKDEIDNVQFAMHTLPNAFMSLYVVTSTENWADIMYELQEFAVSTLQRSFGSIIIMLWFIISNSIVMNIFIAVIAKSLEISEDGKRKHQLRQFIEDMTQKLQAVRTNPGWIHLLKTKLFGKGEERNIEKAVTNLLLSGTAVNDFLEIDEENGEEDTYFFSRQQPENTKGPKWLQKPLEKWRNRTQNPFFNKKKRKADIDGDFNLATFAKEVILERRNLIHEQDEYLKANPMFNTVFYMLEPRHRLRRMCQRIVPSSHGERIDGVDPHKTISEIFGLFMFVSTIGIVVTACYLTPLMRREVIDKYGQYNWTFYVDDCFMAIFTTEFLIKIFADGLMLTPNAYVRSPWNWLDFCALLSLWFEFIAFLQNDGNLSKVVRGLKALRALRILTISETAKNNFHFTMISGFGKIVSAAIISLTLIFPFSIWGLNIFNGRLGYCVDGESDLQLCINEYANEVFDWEVLSPNVWVNPILEMNKFSSSFATIYEIVSLEGWTDLLINVMQSTGVGTPQQMFASPFNGFFVIVFNFLSVVFILTLFVSVIIDNYSRVTGRAYLTTSQRQWYHVKKFLMQVKPSKRRNPETLVGLRKFCYRMTVEKNKVWGSVLNLVLVLHIFALLLESFPETTQLTTARYAAFTTSASCFTVHYMMFGYAQGWKVFVANKWNVFCCLISAGSWISTILSYHVGSGSLFINFNKLFLVGMLVFIFPRSDRLNQLLKFASASFPQLISLLFTWFVMFMVYAIAMNQVFGMTKIGENTTGNINARSVPKALILLFRCSMGEGWNYIMADFTLEAPFCESTEKLDDSDCGNKQYAYLLFMLWNVISMYIMLNLFVSLILDSFSYINGGSNLAHLLSREEIRKFKQKWQNFDPEGSGFIDPDDLPKLLHSLDGALSFHFYTGVLSIPELCDKWIKRNNPLDPYDITVNYQLMNDIMLVMDIPKIQERRKQYEQFMEEARLNMELHEEPGISFKRLILQIPLYSSLDARQCLTLIDFLERRLFLKKLEKRMKTKRCYELLEGYICRWKHVKDKREDKRQSRMDENFVFDYRML